MLPGKYNLTLYRGDSFSRGFRLWADKAKTLPVDLDGATVAAEIRNKPGGEVMISMDCTIVLPNEVWVSLTPDMWIGVPAGNGAWDLEVIFANDEIHTPLAGKVTITVDVTNSTLDAGTFVALQGVPEVKRPATLRSA